MQQQKNIPLHSAIIFCLIAIETIKMKLSKKKKNKIKQ